MQIANPIYDVVFKYLLDDEKVAKLILSTITGLNIRELEFKPTEYRSDLDKDLTVFHLDFIAKIKDENQEEKLIIIEIQKAKLPSDIMRFRRYLGEQYMSKKNIAQSTSKDHYNVKALPLLSIYFLGHKLSHTQAPIIKVQRDYINLIDGTKIEDKEEFIESLTHDSFIIQIPFLKSHKRNSLETILSIFDQESKSEDDHILNIKESDYPKKYHLIIRRLLRAISEPEVRKRMDIEDEVLRDFQVMKRVIEENKRKLEQNKKKLEENEMKLEENEKEIKERDIEIEENKKEIEVNKKKIEEKDLALKKLVKESYRIGLSVEKISNLVNLSEEEVRNLLKEKK